MQQLQYGTSGAQSIALSFWVRSNKTGNYGIRFSQEDTSPVRQYATTYTISSADTWEYKTVVITGDTSGTINNDNGEGLQIRFYLQAGPDRAGTPAETWNTDTDNRATDLNFGDSTDNEWLLSGVQLEVGSVATPFEHRSYGDELRRCQRYYWQTPTGVSGNMVFTGFANTTSNSIILTVNPVPMRAAPSFSSVSDWQIIDGTAFTVSSFAFQQATELTGRLDCTCSSLTTSRPNILRNNSTTATLQFSAEL